VVDVWAFLERQRERALARARREAEEPLKVKSGGPARIRRGAKLTVLLHIADLEIAEPRGQLAWDGEIASVSFAVAVPEAITPGVRVGMATICVRSVPIVRLAFQVTVGAGAGERQVAQVQERRTRSAFASYAHQDRPAVLPRVHGLQKAGVDVFVDVLRLRSGDRYERELEREIESADVFFLFWSRAARASSWVEKEWRLALERRGIDFIDPFPLESPEVAPPPAELAGSLHFNDWILAFANVRAAARPWWRIWGRD
jgi:hypothetical protein